MPQHYNTTVVNRSAAQDGQVTNIIGPWSDVAADFYAYGVATTPAGIAFQLIDQFDAERGLPLDPPGFVGLTLTLNYLSWLPFAGAPTGTVGLYLMDSPTPAAWTDSNRPTTTGATLLTTLTVSDALTPLTYTFDAAEVRTRTTSPQWRGRLAFVLLPDAATVFVQFVANESLTAAIRPVLATTEFPFNTGIVVPDWRRAGRIRICPRSGTRAFADEFVRDGYVDGQWVHADEYDPPDNSDDFIVPASEGSINDEVP